MWSLTAWSRWRRAGREARSSSASTADELACAVMQPEPDAPWLEALAGADAAEFRALGRERRYDRGVVLFHHGDEPGAVAAILAGRVKLVVPGPQGKDVMLGL